MLDITVKTLDGKNTAYSVESNITVKDFKNHIAPSIGIAGDQQRIIFKGKVLQDDVKLADCDVSGKVVHVVQKAPPGAAGTGTSRGSAAPPSVTAQAPPATAAGPHGGGTSFMMASFSLPGDLTDARQINTIVESVMRGMGPSVGGAHVQTRSDPHTNSVDVHIDLRETALGGVSGASMPTAAAPSPDAVGLAMARGVGRHRLQQIHRFLDDASRVVSRIEELDIGPQVTVADTGPPAVRGAPAGAASENVPASLETGQAVTASQTEATDPAESSSSVAALAESNLTGQGIAAAASLSPTISRHGTNDDAASSGLPASALADVVARLAAVTLRFQPMLARYGQLATQTYAASSSREDSLTTAAMGGSEAASTDVQPVRSPSRSAAAEMSSSARREQVVLEGAAEAMHLLGHIYHGVSDLMVDCSRPPGERVVYPAQMQAHPLLLPVHAAAPVVPPPAYATATASSSPSVLLSQTSPASHEGEPAVGVQQSAPGRQQPNIEGLHSNASSTPPAAPPGGHLHSRLRHPVAHHGQQPAPAAGGAPMGGLPHGFPGIPGMVPFMPGAYIAGSTPPLVYMQMGPDHMSVNSVTAHIVHAPANVMTMATPGRANGGMPFGPGWLPSGPHHPSPLLSSPAAAGAASGGATPAANGTGPTVRMLQNPPQHQLHNFMHSLAAMQSARMASPPAAPDSVLNPQQPSVATATAASVTTSTAAYLNPSSQPSPLSQPQPASTPSVAATSMPLTPQQMMSLQGQPGRGVTAMMMPLAMMPAMFSPPAGILSQREGVSCVDPYLMCNSRFVLPSTVMPSFPVATVPLSTSFAGGSAAAAGSVPSASSAQFEPPGGIASTASEGASLQSMLSSLVNTMVSAASGMMTASASDGTATTSASPNVDVALGANPLAAMYHSMVSGGQGGGLVNAGGVHPSASASTASMAPTAAAVINTLRSVLQGTGASTGHNGAESDSSRDLFTGLIATVAEELTQSNRAAGQRPSSTIHSVLDRLSSDFGFVIDTGSSSGGILMNLFDVCSRQLSFSDLMQLQTGDTACLDRLRQPLCAFVRTHILNDGPTTVDNVTAAINRLVEDMGPQLREACGNIEINDNIDMAATLQEFFRQNLRTVVCMILGQGSRGSEDSGEFGRRLYTLLHDIVHDLCRLLLHCFREGSQALVRFVQIQVAAMSQGANSPIVDCLSALAATQMHSLLPQVATATAGTTEAVATYLVRRQPSAAPAASPNMPPVSVPASSLACVASSSYEEDSKNVKVRSDAASPDVAPGITSSHLLTPVADASSGAVEVTASSGAVEVTASSAGSRRRMAASAASSAPATMLDDRPAGLPAVTHQSGPAVSSVSTTLDEWRAQLPPDWVPIIERDIQRQRDEPKPLPPQTQSPYSEAYLSGVPAKKRKIMAPQEEQNHAADN